MLEDYLRAVSRLLPRVKRDDIIAELRDEILTRIEAKEGELGRALSEAETEQLLRDFGHPIVVAARYRDEPQYAVGPALYPYWMFAVRFVIIIEVLVSAIVFVARSLAGVNPGEAFGQAIGSGLTGVMTLIGFATAGVWLVERRGINVDYLKTWRVRDLRFLDFAFWEWGDFMDWLQTHQKPHRNAGGNGGGARRTFAGHDYSGYYGWTLRQSSAGRGVGAIALGVVFILWWTGVLSFGLNPVAVDYAAMHIDPGALASVDFPALKAAVYWPVLAWFAAMIAFGAVVLAWPRGVRLRGVIDMTIGLAVMGLALWVWTASPIADAVRVESAQSLFSRIQAFFAHPLPVPLELGVTVFLILFAFGGFCRAVGGLWELLTGAPRYPADL